MKEETGLDVSVGPVVDVFNRITRDGQGRVRFHYVLVDFLCRVRAAYGTWQRRGRGRPSRPGRPGPL